MTILLISTIVCTVLIAATIILLAIRQPKKQDGELLRLSEPTVTAVMGVMMIAMGFSILYMKSVNATIAGTDLTSYLFVGGFAVVCVAISCGTLFFTFLKKIIAFEDKVVFVTISGQLKELRWIDITEVKVPILSNKVTLIGNNARFSLGGDPKTYKVFLQIAKKKIKPVVCSDVFEKLLNR